MQSDKPPSVTVRPRQTRPRPVPEFPGCRPMFLRCDEVATYDGRFEFWDAATETAWVVRDPTSATHEYPSHRLSALSELIASMRGAAITCFGAMDLELRGEHGERRRILQADQSVYLHPGRSRLPREAGMVIGEHDFRTWWWRWTTRRTFEGGSSVFTRSGAFPRCGWRFPNGMRPAARPAGCRGS